MQASGPPAAPAPGLATIARRYPAAVVAVARPTRPAPHTRDRGQPITSFEALFEQLTHRARERPEGSGTVAALDAGVHAIGKKVVEEAAEVWMAAEHEGREAAAEEISQLLYHLQVLMLALDLDLDDVYAHL